ncbi:diguanylate cyclase [Ruegeria sp. HKCCD7255]|uniref:diguanylate cyclase n=1 Tax=Ruegeria sp. HKCCD7255 TaxID=2683004 RepID=UPI00148960F0|nr:diguanylate cyclase [Ruegeria sp. HKCCD7255]
MSLQGTILVLDGVSTNRIMLKVQLTAAWYQVVQAECLDGLAALLRRVRPDLVLTAQSLPDGTAEDVKKLLASDPKLEDVPIVAIVPQNDKSARMQALAAGLDDAIEHPFKDTLLLARVRSLLRARAERQELRIGNDPQTMGFAEPAADLLLAHSISHVAILSQSAQMSMLWRNALAERTTYSVSCHTRMNLSGLLSGTLPNAVIVKMRREGDGLSILADLRSRRATRQTVLIAVLEDENTNLAAEALDRGADAVCMSGFDADEIALRLEALIARKSRDDNLRATMREGLADALTDPLTGLHNRRYAMRAMAQITRQSLQSGRGFAVMLADLDHFKTINDRFGHAGGDLVLTETARRLKSAIGKKGFAARIGGEEFMIVLPETTSMQALELADVVCNCICNTPFLLPDQHSLITATISVGVNLCEPPQLSGQLEKDPIDHLIRSADQALYAAKQAGRNQVQIGKTAA